MFFNVYAFKGQVHVATGQVKIVSHSSCRKSAKLKYFCPLRYMTPYKNLWKDDHQPEMVDTSTELHAYSYSFLVSYVFCCLFIMFANSLDPDQDRQNVGPDMDPDCLHSDRARPRSAVGNVSGYRCVSDCRSRGREFDPGPVPYFRGDCS